MSQNLPKKGYELLFHFLELVWLFGQPDQQIVVEDESVFEGIAGLERCVPNLESHERSEQCHQRLR